MSSPPSAGKGNNAHATKGAFRPVEDMDQFIVVAEEEDKESRTIR